MVTISPATQFASVPRQVSGESQTFSRTVTANPGTNETIVSTTLTLDREQINLVLEEATLTVNTGVILLEDGDFLVLNRTDLLGSDAGDNLLQEIAVDDASLLLEDATNDEDDILFSPDLKTTQAGSKALSYLVFYFVCTLESSRNIGS